MKFGKLIFVLAIAFTAIFASMIGSSYAYYYATEGVPISVTTSNIDPGIAVVFEQSQYINTNVGVPINEEDVDTLASTSIFTINPNNDFLAESNVAINIGIIDISIDDDLKIDDFKYKFACNDGTSDVISKGGTGADFTEDVINNGYLKLGTLDTVNNTFSYNKDYTCTLRVWLQNNTSVDNQNYLMGKSFTGLIKVNTLFTK